MPSAVFERGRYVVGEDVRAATCVDLAAVKGDGADVRLVVCEAKTYGNGELRSAVDGTATDQDVALHHVPLQAGR